MRPPIEYRQAAPKKAATAVPQVERFIETARMIGCDESEPQAKPKPKGPNGRWVWVTDDQMITTRSKRKSRAYMKEYMRAYRKKRQRPIEKEESAEAGKGDNPR